MFKNFHNSLNSL